MNLSWDEIRTTSSPAEVFAQMDCCYRTLHQRLDMASGAALTACAALLMPGPPPAPISLLALAALAWCIPYIHLLSFHRGIGARLHRVERWILLGLAPRDPPDATTLLQRAHAIGHAIPAHLEALRSSLHHGRSLHRFEHRYFEHVVGLAERHTPPPDPSPA